MHITGSGVCHVTYDGSGSVSSAHMSQSTGNRILDSNTESFAKGNWKGPVNTSADVPITYKLQ